MHTPISIYLYVTMKMRQFARDYVFLKFKSIKIALVRKLSVNPQFRAYRKAFYVGIFNASSDIVLHH